jgi:hypothetical protein
MPNRGRIRPRLVLFVRAAGPGRQPSRVTIRQRHTFIVWQDGGTGEQPHPLAHLQRFLHFARDNTIQIANMASRWRVQWAVRIQIRMQCTPAAVAFR